MRVILAAYNIKMGSGHYKDTQDIPWSFDWGIWKRASHIEKGNFSPKKAPYSEKLARHSENRREKGNFVKWKGQFYVKKDSYNAKTATYSEKGDFLIEKMYLNEKNIIF